MLWLYDRIGYLRKSRQDNPDETVEEVLAKHEAIIQEYCEREFGGRIPAENLYREIISGESLDERVEIKKILSAIENPAIKGVVVVEPSRLSRGDLEDCARVISSFRFSNTEINTPMMTYDLNNKMERKFFQDELLRGNDYLEYTKEILFRGRLAAAKRGCYINQIAPYGYDKVKIGKDHTLAPNEQADAVKLIFQWFANDCLTTLQIAHRLDDMGIKPTLGGKWHKDFIRAMLKNQHYLGKIVFNQAKTVPVLEEGIVVKKRLKQAQDDILICEGKHPALVDQELWDKAQTRFHPAPRVIEQKSLRNELAGVLFCAKCGKALYRQTYRAGEDRFTCRSDPRCCKSVKKYDLIESLIVAIQNTELPALEAKVKNGEGDARKIQERLLAKLEKQMEEYRAQEDKQYELLETGKYTQDLFDRRNATLRTKMDECQTAIFNAKASLPQDTNYEESINKLKEVIAALRDETMSVIQKNRLIKEVIERIEYSGPAPIYADKRKGEARNVTPFTLAISLRV